MKTLADEALALLNNEEKKKELGENIKQLAKPNAANEIAEIILGEMGF